MQHELLIKTLKGFDKQPI